MASGRKGRKPDSAMTVPSVIRLCLERGQAQGLDLPRQQDLALEVVRRLRPQWSDSQIRDSISRTARDIGGASTPTVKDRIGPS